MEIKRTQTISNEEYITILKPYDEVYAQRLEEGMKSFHEVDDLSQE